MLHYFKAIFLRGIAILWAYLTWMKRYSKHPDRYPISMRYKKLAKLVRSVAKSLNVEFHVEGQEYILNEPFYLVSNHLSSFDPLAFMCVLDQPTSFIAKIETKKMPFVGLCIKILNGLFIDRDDIKQSLKTMMTLTEFLQDKSRNWMIFPEGKRNFDQMALCSEFHHGTFRAATRTNTPILPAAIFGTPRVLHTKPEYKKYPIFIKFLPPLMPSEYENMSTREIAKQIQDTVQKEVSFHLRIIDHQYMSKRYMKKYRFNRID
ncbi:MAG TPA: lysophospholipid acyltransferase family protein [Bacilli bacterium]|nr:lysophospholipid acyltransferase family protein [Bacilli bacterium]HPS19245.1 lysophospholipid acyltransferase family protein [Bacilli bacterium]